MRGTVLIFLTTASLAATAQQLPPVFAGKTAKTDSLTRAYITPERVVWAHGSYSLWYLIIQHDWYMHGADATFLEKHRGYIMGLIDKIDPLVDEDGTEHLEEEMLRQK